MPRLTPKETANRIWVIRKLVGERKKKRQEKITFELSMDQNLNRYIEEFGLPSGYLSKEQLVEEMQLTLI